MTAAKRIITRMLVLLMILSYMPVFGGLSYAQDKDLVKLTPEQAERLEVEWSDDLAITKEDAAKLGINADGSDDFTDSIQLDAEDFDDDEPELEPVEGCSTDIEKIPAEDISGKDGIALNGDPGYTDDQIDASIDVQLDSDKRTATVTGTVSGDTFSALYVDDYYCDVDIRDKTSFTETIDMKDYPVGVHTVYAVLTNHWGEEYYVKYPYGVPTYIYSSQKPKISLSYFTTGPKKLQYYYGGSSLSQDSSCDVFLDYRKGSGSWKTYKTTSTSSYSPNTVSKTLKPKSAYKVRTYFGKKGTYNGEAYFIKGKYSSTKTVKTGSNKKLSIKSITTTKAKVKYSGWTFTPYYGGIPGTPVPIYYTTFKMTIKLKKKPGTTGIMRDSMYIKGNKKKYTQKCTWSGGKNAYKGKRVKCYFRSYQSKTYGGYSPRLTKKVKVR